MKNLVAVFLMMTVLNNNAFAKEKIIATCSVAAGFNASHSISVVEKNGNNVLNYSVRGDTVASSSSKDWLKGLVCEKETTLNESTFVCFTKADLADQLYIGKDRKSAGLGLIPNSQSLKDAIAKAGLKLVDGQFGLGIYFGPAICTF